MLTIPLDLTQLSTKTRDALARAPYFTLEATYETEDSYALSTIAECEDDGTFAIHVGAPDRPDHGRALTFTAFEDAVAALEGLKRVFPAAGLWLSCLEVAAEVRGDDIWRGIVEARATFDPGDPDDEWNELAAAIAERDANGTPIVVDPNAHAVIAVVAAHL